MDGTNGTNGKITMTIVGDFLPRGDGSFILRPRRIEPAGQWITVKEAANRLGVHRMTVYRLLDAGYLKTRRVSARKTTISVDSLEQHLQRAENGELWE